MRLYLHRDYKDDVNYDKMVKRMDDNGIDVTAIIVVDDLYNVENDKYILNANEQCARAAARHPGRLLSLAGIDPRRPKAPALFRKCITDFKMNGLKWHPDQGYYPNSKEAYSVLAVANEFGVPLLTHCLPLSRSRAKFAHPIHLDDIALDFPNVQIIAAHMGGALW
jgi:predicted TIM-barrel fold metal-dependent hydrolase